MDSWKRFDEILLSNKENFHGDLIQMHAKTVKKGFKRKSLGDYHNLYVQSDTLLLADVFEILTNKYIEIYELDPAHFLSAPGLALEIYLNKHK